MAYKSWFDSELYPNSWFEPELNKEAWFDSELIPEAAPAGGIVTPTGTGLSQYNTSGHTTNTLAITFPSDSKYIAIDVMATHFSSVSAITSVTVDGQAATAVTGTDTGGLNAGVWIREWGYEIDPVAAGVTLGSSVNVVVTFAGTVTVSQNVAQAFTVDSGYDLSSEGGFNSGLVAAGGGTKTCSPTTTTVSGNYLFGGYINFGGSVADVATVDTQVAENFDSNNGTITNTAMSAITGSGETLGWTDLTFYNWAAHVWVIKSTASGGGGVTGTGTTSQAQTASGSGSHTVAAVTGTGATSQAQTSAGSGTHAPAAVTATGSTSQAQTAAGSGSYSAAGVDGTGATSQAQTASGSGTHTIGAVTGVGATSQAQTASGSGTHTVAAVSGTGSTSQTQTASGSGLFGTGVDGTGETSQAQTSDGSGTFTLAAVTGSGSTSQAQTAVGSGSHTVAAVTGTGSTSQAQTADGSGLFTAAGVVNGTGSTSQAQTSSGSGVHVAPVAPEITIRGGGIDHQIKRRKATLSDKPNQHLDQIIAKAFKTVFGELTDKKTHKTVQKQANKIVSEYTEEYRPKFDEIDWFAFNQDLEAVQRLFALYQREIADARQIAENKRIFDIIENDNLEFLLMH